jgi:DnaJ-class molecular chaperone
MSTQPLEWPPVVHLEQCADCGAATDQACHPDCPSLAADDASAICPDCGGTGVLWETVDDGEHCPTCGGSGLAGGLVMPDPWVLFLGGAA